MARRWYVSDNDGVSCSIRDADDADAAEAGECGLRRAALVAQSLTPTDAGIICAAVNGDAPVDDALLFFVGERTLDAEHDGTPVDGGAWVGDGGDSIRLVEIPGSVPLLPLGGRAAAAAAAFMRDKCDGACSFVGLGASDGYLSIDFGNVERLWFGLHGGGRLPVLTCVWVWAAPVVVAVPS